MTRRTRRTGASLAEVREAFEVMVDAMRRSDPEYCAAHDEPPCCDEDWDTAIQAGEDMIEELDAMEPMP